MNDAKRALDEMFYKLIQGISPKPHFYKLANASTGEITRVLDGIGSETVIDPVLDLDQEVFDHVIWRFGVGEMMSHAISLEVDYSHNCLALFCGAAEDRAHAMLPDYNSMGIVGEARPQPDWSTGVILLAPDVRQLASMFDRAVKRFCQPVWV